MTLALLLTAVTGAWADETPLVTINASSDFTSGSKTFDNKVTATFSQGVAFSADKGWFASSAGNKTLTVEPVDGVTITRVKFYTTLGNEEVIKAPFEASMSQTYVNVSGGSGSTTSQLRFHVSVNGIMIGAEKSFNFLQKIEVYGTAEPPIVVDWDASTNTGTFDMPGSDVVLTPIYSAATISHAAGTPDASETAFETLKEAFANVQDGDVITLDWNVTLTEDLKTPTIQGGAKFILDFNGYTLDCGTNYICLTNAGDELTLKDTSGKDKLGGLKCIGTNAVENAKYIFDSGRYKFGEYSTAEYMNALYATTDGYELADGKEFIDLEGGPDADDFNLTVGYAAFELAIGKGRFATFYAAQNVALDAEQAAAGVGLYTIESQGIDLDNNKVYVTKLNDPIAIAGMPLLVYNGSEADMIVKLTVTPDAPTAGQMWSQHFCGTAEAREFTATDMAAADYYVLSGGKAFAPVYEPGTIAKNKCWLQFDHANGAPARSITLVFDNDDATGINEVIEVNEVSDDSWYDLNGRKLNAAPIKGVYIKDGKKVVR